MEVGVAVSSRSSFRKPSHTTSQRNYRRRSPSSGSRSRSRSRSASHPQQALSGGWEQDQIPLSPQRCDPTSSSLHAKKGRRNDASDEDSHGRHGGSGPGFSERQTRCSSYDRVGLLDSLELRRSASHIYERNHSSHGLYCSRDSYFDTRRKGGYEYQGRGRQSPNRGYRDNGRSRDRGRRRSRDRDRDGQGYTRRTNGASATNVEMESDLQVRSGKSGKGRDRDTDQDRSKERERATDRDRGRNRHRETGKDRNSETDRSRGRRSAKRDTIYERDHDMERRHRRSKSRDGEGDRQRDTERIKTKVIDRELSIDQDYEAGEIDSEGMSKEIDNNREMGKETDFEKRRNKFGEGDVTHSKLDIDDGEWSGEKYREEEREKLKETRITSELDGVGKEAQEDTRGRSGERVGRKLRNVDVDREKDLDLGSQKRDRGGDWPRYSLDSKSPDRHRDQRDERKLVDGVDIKKARVLRSKEQSTENLRKDEKEDAGRNFRIEEYRTLDRLLEKEERSGTRSEKERNGKKGRGNPEHSSHHDRDRENSSSLGRASRNDIRSIDALSDREKIVVKQERGKYQTVRVKEEDGSHNSDIRDREGSKDRKYVKHNEDSIQQGRLPTSASDSETKVPGTSDGKAAKGSKWGPGISDSAAKPLASDTVASDLTAAKLAAMKAAELVNKNLGVAGFMSADQKKRLLWGSKKLSAEQPLSHQEPAAAAGINRWDTVHFTDPDRREKFQKLMGVKADTCTESSKEGDPDAGAFTEERQRELQQDLEKQFTAGLRRRDGGKVGLGL